MRTQVLTYVFVVCSLMSIRLSSQNYFKQYIDSENHCNESANKVFDINDSIFSLNFITCGETPSFTTLWRYNSWGFKNGDIELSNLVTNINSCFYKYNQFHICGISNDLSSNSKLLINQVSTNFDSNLISSDLLQDTLTNIILNPIGILDLDSFQVVYGQFQIVGNPIINSFIRWRNILTDKDTLMTFENNYEWSIISDAKTDQAGNLVILMDVSKVIDHVKRNYRIVRKFNSEFKKIFEWVSFGFFDQLDLGSLVVADSNIIVLDFISEELDNARAIVALNESGEIIWTNELHPFNSNEAYRINDLALAKDGNVLFCGTYRNVGDDIFETGYVGKVSIGGDILWERIFYDNEEMYEPNSGIKKIMNFNSIVEDSNGDIVIAGNVIHNSLSAFSNSDVVLIKINSFGCLFEDCASFQNITRLNGFNDKNKVWTEGKNIDSSDGAYSNRFKFDFVPVDLNGFSYYTLMESNYEDGNNWYSTGKLFRYEGNKLFRYRPNQDEIMYDFNLIVGDTFILDDNDEHHKYLVTFVDSISLFNGDIKKRLKLEAIDPVNILNSNEIFWIEDIGNSNGLFSNSQAWELADYELSKILCIHLSDNIIYEDTIFDKCWVESTSTVDMLNSNVIISPNPTRDKVNLLFNYGLIHSVCIYNDMGETIYRGKDLPLSISSFPSGIYWVIIQFNNFGTKSGIVIKM